MRLPDPWGGRRARQRRGEYAPVVLTLAYCGLRWGEVAVLRVRDVDQVRRRLSLQENAVMVGRIIVVGIPKSHERREVAYPKLLAPLIDARVRGRAPDALLFEAPLGGYMVRPNTSENTTSWNLRALKEAGLERMACTTCGTPRPASRSVPERTSRPCSGC